MADFKIKSTAGTGNKTLIQSQDQSGSAYAIEVGDTGALRLGTITSGTFPTGMVLQTLSTAKTDTTSRSGAHSDWADISGMSVAITPSATSSKILVLCSLQFGHSNNDTALAVKLVRGSTDIFIGDASGSRTRATGQPARIRSEYDMHSMVINFLDSPSSTSATTYKLQWHSPYDGNTMYLNRSGNDGDSSDRVRGASSITVMEIAG